MIFRILLQKSTEIMFFWEPTSMLIRAWAFQ